MNENETIKDISSKLYNSIMINDYECLLFTAILTKYFLSKNIKIKVHYNGLNI